MARLVERPIFIVGHPRSGTTLLRFILSSHPRIHIPEETGFIPFLLRDDELDAELTLTQVRGVLERIGTLNHLWRGMVGDVASFYEALPEPKLAHVLDALYRQQIQEYGASRWGDKTPLYVRYIAALDRVFPTAQFVHLIRDGRDAALSALEKWPDRHWYMDTYYLIKNWVRNVESGREEGARLEGDRYLEVRYENLVEQPEEVVQRICGFLNEQLHPGMLEHTLLANRVGPGPQDHVEVLQPISTTSVQRWKSQMSSFDQRLSDRLAGRLLASVGYQLADRGPFSAGERLKLLLLAGKFRLTDTTRSMLYASGILTLNRDMRR